MRVECLQVKSTIDFRSSHAIQTHTHAKKQNQARVSEYTRIFTTSRIWSRKGEMKIEPEMKHFASLTAQKESGRRENERLSTACLGSLLVLD